MTPVRKTSAEVIADAIGQWPYILDDLSSGALSVAIASWQKHPNEHVDCPICGGAAKFRLFKDFAETGGGVCSHCGYFKKGVSLLAAVTGGDSKSAFREIAKWLRGEEYTPTVQQRPKFVYQPPDYTKAKERLTKARKECRDIFGTLAEEYLVNRGISRTNISKKLKFHPGMVYFDKAQGKKLGTFGCMIAEVTNAKGQLMCLHRTFLDVGGKKADVPKAKKLMEKAVENLAGCSVKLHPATEVLGLAEGIETALAAYSVARIPVWSCISAGMLETVHIPDIVRHVVIFADLDRSGKGLSSAEKLEGRLIEENKKREADGWKLPRITMEIVIPEGPIPEGEKGVDWNDVLKKQGVQGFPERWRNCLPRNGFPAVVRAAAPVVPVVSGNKTPVAELAAAA